MSNRYTYRAVLRENKTKTYWREIIYHDVYETYDIVTMTVINHNVIIAIRSVSVNQKNLETGRSRRYHTVGSLQVRVYRTV